MRLLAVLRGARNACAAVLLFSVAAPSQPVQSPANGGEPEIFNRHEVMIPMRDGMRLQTVIFTPKKAAMPLPFLINRTPYGVPEDGKSLVESGSYDELIADGYIFVVQNIRGRFKSEG